MARTTTLTQSAKRRDYGDIVSGASFTENITTPTDNLEVSTATFTISDLLPTAMTGKIVWPELTQGTMEATIDAKINNTSMASVRFQTSNTQGARIPWASGAIKTLYRVSNIANSLNTSDFFNSSNPTVKQLNLSWSFAVEWNNFIGSNGYTLITPTVNTITSSFNQTITLNVPPTATVSAITYDKPFIYAGLTTASITVSDVTAYYGGTITDVTFRIGAQTASAAGDGTLSILLDTAGTFTPTLTITDSRGQTYTEQFAPITVLTYSAPTVSFTAERTTAAGAPDDEGTYATCPATFIFADAIATAVAPSVVLTDENGTQTTPTVSWYTTRAADGTLSGSVTWSSLASGDTVYASIPGLNTNYSYQISIRPRDSQGTGTAITQTVSSAFYTVDFLAGGHGIAFGQPSSQPGFECNMPTIFHDTVTVEDDADFGAEIFIELPNYQTSGVDKDIYDAVVALGWDSDVLIP